VAALKRGDVIVFPTETLYGLGADACDLIAVEKVLALKGREANNPIPVLVADRVMLSELVAEIPPLAEKLIEQFWPGPLTLVLPARRDIPYPLLNVTGGVGVRISSQPIAAQLLDTFRRPMTATSANLSGQIPSRTIAQARKYFAGQVDVFVDGGELTAKVGSTVAEIFDEKIRIIREGEISRSRLGQRIGAERILP
jgi:L-threonylcarbamoyladenylate synthase